MIEQKDLERAREIIRPYLHRTPVLSSRKINELAGAELYFKCENFQKTGSFKARGATVAVQSLDDAAAAKGVATHSSGNHGQALAWAAAQRGIEAHIVMPENAPQAKVEAVRAYGGRVHFCAPNLRARQEGLEKVQAEYGSSFIPPYDYHDVICGQASCAWELLEEQADLDCLIAPVGGGGLLSGTALSAHYFSPRVKVFAGEPQGADDAFRSFYSGARISEQEANTIADGLRTTLGTLNFPIIQDLVDDIFTVSDEEIIAAMKLIYRYLKIVIEPSCAVPLAAILARQEVFEGQKVGVILTGGNVDLEKLPF